jgi:integrative and conjugative element protein (TIGR02256 family)
LAALPPDKLPGRILHAALYQAGKVGLMTIEGNDRNPNVSDLSVQFKDMWIESEDISSAFRTSNDTVSRRDVGLGCGSYTMVMPDTRVSLYAAGMAERARQVLEGRVSQKGELWVGFLAEDDLQVSWRRVELGKTQVLKVKAENTWAIRILENALAQVSTEALKYGQVETGGVLIGRISLARRCITISRVLEAPPDSERSPTRFVLGTQGLLTRVKEIYVKSGNFLNYVGTWHSHPKGGGASELDKESLEQLRRLRFGAPAISLIWTPTGFSAIMDEGKLS